MKNAQPLQPISGTNPLKLFWGMASLSKLVAFLMEGGIGPVRSNDYCRNWGKGDYEEWFQDPEGDHPRVGYPPTLCIRQMLHWKSRQVWNQKRSLLRDQAIAISAIAKERLGWFPRNCCIVNWCTPETRSYRWNQGTSPWICFWIFGRREAPTMQLLWCISPTTTLLPSAISLRFEHPEMFSGNWQENEILSRCNAVNRRKFPISGRNLLVNPLLYFIILRKLILPM